jgi:surface polysaccharide O-acyltransferase-like enzyme
LFCGDNWSEVKIDDGRFGTLLQAFFSMTFFNFQENNTGNQQFQVSDKWWYFVAATVPLTAVVFVIWIFWQKWRFGRANKDSKTVRVRLDVAI